MGKENEKNVGFLEDFAWGWSYVKIQYKLK